MTFPWLAATVTLIAALLSTRFLPFPCFGCMSIDTLLQWRSTCRRLCLISALSAVLLMELFSTSTAAARWILEVLAGLALAIGLRALGGWIRSAAELLRRAHRPDLAPTAFASQLADPSLAMPWEPNPTSLSAYDAQRIAYVRAHYREHHAQAISRKLGRRVIDVTPALAEFWLQEVGTDSGWEERLYAHVRRWLEPTVFRLRWDAARFEEPLVWDLDGPPRYPRLVLLRTDEAASHYGVEFRG